MNHKLLLVVAVLALSACEAKKPEEVVVAPAPASASVVPTPTSVAEPVIVKSVQIPTAPTVVAPAPALEAKPVVAVIPLPVAEPAAVPQPVAPVSDPKPVVPVVVAFSDADGIALGKKRNCFACHLIDKKVVGPAWKDVASKYRGDAGAQARMEAKIGKGGGGAWGSMAMPAQPQVTAEDRAILARFILNLK